MAITFDATLGTVTNAATLTTSAAAAAGSRVIVCVWWYEAPTCTGCSGGGLTWVVDFQDDNPLDANNNMAFLSADAPSGLASSTNITPTFSGGVIGPGIAAHSWTGLATGSSGYVDATAAATQQFSDTWATGNVTTTMADTVVLGMGWATAGTHTATGSYTERHEWTAEGSNLVAVVSQIVSSAASYTPGGTWASGAGDTWDMGIAYEASGVAAAPPALVAAREFNGGRFGPF